MKLRITHHSPAYWRVTLDNPPLNLLDHDVTYELRDLIDQMETVNELKVIVFDSANPDFYIGHVDIIRSSQLATSVGPTGLRILQGFLKRLAILPVISISSICGRARGLGAEFVEGLDIRFGSKEKMILGKLEMGCGLVSSGGGSVYLPLLVGRSNALEIIASREDYNADIAEHYGGLIVLFRMRNWDDFVDKFARRIASFDKEVIMESKRLVIRSSHLPDDAQIIVAG
jgi:enoyl-CoA hydratase/carnithine racemase